MISASLAVCTSGKAQCAGLVALEIVGVDELEALTERAAMLLDRLPVGRVGRVVDDDHALEIGIFEPRHRIERRLEHLRRLAIGRDVDRHFRREGFGRQRRRRPAGAAAGGRTRPSRSLPCARARWRPAAPAAARRGRARRRRRARNSGPSRTRRWPRTRRRPRLAETASIRACGDGHRAQGQDRQRQQQAEQHARARRA